MSEMLEFAVKLSMLTSGMNTTAFSQATQAMQKMQTQMQNLKNASGQVGEYQKLRTNIEQTAQRLNAARERVRVLREQMKQTPQPTASMRREFTQANIEANKLSQTLMSQRKSLAELGHSLTSAGINTRNLTSEQQRLSRQTDQLKAAQERLTTARERLNSIRERLNWGNIKGDIFSAIAPVMTLKPMVKISGDFEEAMQKVKAVGFSSEGADLTQFNEMKAQALRLGAETSFTAIQAANAQENLIRAGFSPDETMKAMPGLLNMAAAESIDLAQAASIVSGSIKSIGLEAKDAEYVSDLFAFASAHSATDIPSVGEAFKVAAGEARILKVEADQLTAMLMSLANQQVNASEAGTALDRTFLRLTREPKSVADALKKYQIRLRTRDGDMRELPDVLVELYNKTQKLGTAGQLGAFGNVFGGNFAGSMVKLAQASLPGKNGAMSEYERNLKGLREESKGQSQRMTDINLDSLNGQLTILGSAIDGVKIALGDMFNPYVRSGVEFLTNALSGLNKILLEFPDESKRVVLFISALAGLKAAKSIINLGRAIVSLPFAWLEYMNATRAASAITGEKVSLMQRAFTMILHPIQTLKTAFISLWGVVAAHPFLAIIAALSAIYYYWDDIKAGGIRAWQAIRKAGDEFLAWWDSWSLSDIWQPVVDSFNAMIDYFTQKWQGFKDFFSSLNPMNWFSSATPEQAASQQKIMQASPQGQNAQSIADRYSSAYKTYATGGILTSPHLGLVAEAGPEAIVPLRNKTRGLEVLTQAANILGVNLTPESESASMNQVSGMNINRNTNIERLSERMTGNETRNIYNDSRNNTNNDVVNRPSNVINIQVDGRDQDDMNLAGRIANAVRDALSEIMNENVRLNYA